jgi:hypothetical protein
VQIGNGSLYDQFTLYITKFDCTTSTKPQILTTKILSALAFRHYIDKKKSNNCRHKGPFLYYVVVF